MPAPTPLPTDLKKRDSARLQSYRSNLSLYEGDQWPRDRSRNRTGARQLTPNYIRALVDKTTAYVLAGATLQVQPLSETAEAATAARAAEELARQIEHDNGLDLLDHVTEIDTAILGDGCFKLAWLPDEKRVAVTAPDMAGIFPTPHPADLHRFLRVAHRYTLTAEEIATTYNIATATGAATASVIEDWTATELSIYINDKPTPDIVTPNPYGVIPFVIFPNKPVPKRWYGASDVDAVKDTALELNRAVTRLANVLELSGYPIAVLENVDNTTDIVAVPGAVWELPENAKAYVLDLLKDGGGQVHLDYIERTTRILEDLSETPRSAFGGVQQPLSGVALQIDLQPLQQKTARKRAIRAAAYAERMEKAFAIHAKNGGQDHTAAGRIVINWAPVIPTDDTADTQREASRVAAKLASRQSALARLGDDDPAAEWERIKAEETELAALTARPSPA